jgi:hypothetical protein
VVSQDEVFRGATRQSGIGDIVQSGLFSPKNPTASGLICSVAPLLPQPNVSDDLLSAKKWGAGPTGMVLKQQGPWTYGALANHIGSIGGSGSRDINSTFVQPFVRYATPTDWSSTLNTESSYDWESRQWAVPVNAVVAKVTRVGDQLVSLGDGAAWSRSRQAVQAFRARTFRMSTCWHARTTMRTQCRWPDTLRRAAC